MAYDVRALDLGDAVAMHRICTEPSVARTLGTMPTDTLASYEERLAKLNGDQVALLGAFEGERMVGLAQMTGSPRPRLKHAARVWVAVDPAHWRRGVGDLLVGALVELADSWWSLLRLELDVIAAHEGALRLYERHGFVVEARKRADYCIDGELVEGLRMARIRPGWSAPSELPLRLEAPVRGAPIEPGQVILRAPEPTDAAALAALHEHLSVVDTTLQLPFQRPADWLERLGRPGVLRYLAEVGSEVAALAVLVRPSSPRGAHSAELGLAVASGFQGRGVGSAMMSELLRIADEELGLTRIELEVLEDNVRGIKLYERCGFVVEGVSRCRGFRRGSYADGVVMARVRV